MTLLEYLATLKARPSDGTSPTLHTREDDLHPFDLRDIITPAPYSNAPYVIVEGLPRTTEIRMDDNRAVYMGGTIDVSVLQAQDHAATSPMPKAPIAEIVAKVLGARSMVTEIASGYPLVGLLALVTETEPEPRSLSTFAGLIATVRFNYRIAR